MSDTAGPRTHQYLTFVLDGEIFALNIDAVREVLELTTVTRIPRTPEFMRGVINLRGHAVPVVDLRRKFGLRAAPDTVNTCIIIVEVLFAGEATVMGALADSVREVVELTPDQIEPAPRLGAAIRTDFIQGIGRREAEFLMVLDVGRVFSAEELAVATETDQAVAAAAE